MTATDRSRFCRAPGMWQSPAFLHLADHHLDLVLSGQAAVAELSAYWVTLSMIVVVFTQKPLKRLFRGQSAMGEALRKGTGDFVAGMTAGARSMIGIGVATAVAGVIIGTVSRTGAHQANGKFVSMLAGAASWRCCCWLG